MTLTVVVAVAANGVIGRDNRLPWHLPEDLRHFKELTLGKTLLMGRRTFDSIGRALPGRRTVVLTRQSGWSRDGVTVVHSTAEARELIAGQDVVLAGGGELFREFWADVDRLEITFVHRSVEGDTHFLPLDEAEWAETGRDDRDGFSFVSFSGAAPAASRPDDRWRGIAANVIAGYYHDHVYVPADRVDDALSALARLPR